MYLVEVTVDLQQNPRMICRSTDSVGFWFKSKMSDIEFVNEDINESNRAVFNHKVIETFGE